jgi:hypothetical protein
MQALMAASTPEIRPATLSRRILYPSMVGKNLDGEEKP